MSKGHHTTLLWNVFISFVSRSTLKKKSIAQLFQVSFSFLKDFFSLSIMSTWPIPNKYQNTSLSSIHAVSLNLISLSLVTEQPWHVQDRRIVPVDWHRSAHCKWRQSRYRGKTAPGPPSCVTQSRIKGAEFHMAAKEDLCFRMENLHKTKKETLWGYCSL